MSPRARSQTQRALGSGFVIDKSGHILTNAHVVAQAQQVVGPGEALQRAAVDR